MSKEAVNLADDFLQAWRENKAEKNKKNKIHGGMVTSQFNVVQSVVFQAIFKGVFSKTGKLRGVEELALDQ